MADGKYELAASLLESTGDRFGHSPSVTDAKRLVYLKLIEKYRKTDPFKFIIRQDGCCSVPRQAFPRPDNSERAHRREAK